MPTPSSQPPTGSVQADSVVALPTAVPSDSAQVPVARHSALVPVHVLLAQVAGTEQSMAQVTPASVAAVVAPAVSGVMQVPHVIGASVGVSVARKTLKRFAICWVMPGWKICF